MRAIVAAYHANVPPYRQVPMAHWEHLSVMPILSPAEWVRQNFLLEDIEGQQFLVNRATGHIGIVNQSAGIIISMFLAGMGENEIVQAISEGARASRQRIRADVQELIGSLRLQSNASAETGALLPARQQSRDIPPWSAVCHYQLNNVQFSIEFPSQKIHDQISALFATLVIDGPADPGGSIRISIRKDRTGYDLWVDDEHFAHATYQYEVHGYLRGIIIRECYADAVQLTMLHAACVSYQGRAVILAAPSGGGKSTLALALAQRGWGYQGDDTMGVDLSLSRVLPFPTMVSIKRDNWPMFEASFPELNVAQIFRTGAKAMKAIRPPAESIADRGTLPIAGIVFVQFDPEGEPALNLLTTAEALAQLDQSGAVFHPQDIAVAPRHLLQWLQRTPCYAMRHRDIDSAVDLLGGVLEVG